MIFHLGLRRNRWAVKFYKACHAFRWEAGRMQALYYEDGHVPRRPAAGLYIFTDVELLNPAERATAMEWWSRIEANPRRARAWNHPELSLRRFDLLRQLAASGVNDFRVFRVDEGWPENLRYPVFLRDENKHTGPRTDLLHNHQQLLGALAYLARRPAGRDKSLVVEYLPYGDSDGLFRKYGVLRVGSRLIPRHLFISNDWTVKVSKADFDNPKFLAEETAFVADNPHEAELLAVFEQARIDYGRIDYTVVNGRLQIFEINSSPSLFRLPGTEGSRLNLHAEFAERYFDALRAADSDQPVPIRAGISWVGTGLLKFKLAPRIRSLKKRLLRRG